VKTPRVRRRQVLKREDRFLTRAKLGTLSSLAIPPKLRARYESALTRYFAYEHVHSIVSSTTDDFDLHTAPFIEALWQDGEPRYWAEDTLSGFTKLVPALKGKFPMCWSLITAWQRNELPQRATPLTLRLLKAFCGVCITNGWLDLCLILAIGYHCILRTAEMYSMSCGDFTFNRHDNTAILTLSTSKSGTRYNIVESVTVTDAALVRKLRQTVCSRAPGDLLFPLGHRIFRSQFASIVKTLRLPSDLLFTPYSIRRGGATEDFRSHGNIGATTVRGRWANERTCRVYVNQSTALLAEATSSVASNMTVSKMVLVAEDFFGTTRV